MKLASSSASGGRRSRICRISADRLIRKEKGGGGGRDLLRRRWGRIEAESSAIQKLFLTCKSIFGGSGTVPSSSQVRLIHDFLDGMTSADVGLSADIPFFQCKTPAQGAAGVSCTTIYQSTNFSICIFFLRPGAVIPLHDHPGMTVFSKLLLGSLHVRSYDFLDSPNLATTTFPQHGKRRRLAKLTMDGVLAAPCNSSVLFPEAGGNIHDLVAVTPCALLDIMGPPYSAEEGRDITYYKDLPFSEDNVERVVGDGKDGIYQWLEEIEMPKEAAMASVAYLGPPIFDL